MRELLVSLLKKAAEQNFLIAITASLASISPFVLYHHQINFILSIEILFATFFTYTVQRFFGGDSSLIELPLWKVALLVFSSTVIVVLAFFLSHTQVVLLTFAGILSLLYSFPAIPYQNQRRSLRQLPYLKIWVIIAVWLIVICLSPLSELPAFESGDLFTSKMIFIIQQGAFIFALTIPFDIRDLKVDEPHQKTIPMIFGREKSIKLAKSAIWLSFFAAGVNFLLGFFDVEIVFIQLLIALLGLRLLRRAKTVQSTEFYLVRIDGLIALQAVLFLLSYFI